MANQFADETLLVPGFPAYRVSRAGYVESRWSLRVYYRGFVPPDEPDEWTRVGTHFRSDGYAKVCLHDGLGSFRKTYVHILVAELFLGTKPFANAVVRHLDGNPKNNALSNLAWGSHKDNEHDKKAHGTWHARNGGGKLSSSAQAEIRKCWAEGEPQKSLALRFGVSRPTVSRLLNGSVWKGVS